MIIAESSKDVNPGSQQLCNVTQSLSNHRIVLPRKLSTLSWSWFMVKPSLPLYNGKRLKIQQTASINLPANRKRKNSTCRLHVVPAFAGNSISYRTHT